jgi:hypothetical protein
MARVTRKKDEERGRVRETSRERSRLLPPRHLSAVIVAVINRILLKKEKQLAEIRLGIDGADVGKLIPAFLIPRHLHRFYPAARRDEIFSDLGSAGVSKIAIPVNTPVLPPSPLPPFPLPFPLSHRLYSCVRERRAIFR